MDKKQALTIIIKAATLYKLNLDSQNVLFLYGIPTEIRKHLSKTSITTIPIKAFEAAFNPYNFCHLTGVKIDKDKDSAINFYKKCITGKLSVSDIKFNRDGSTIQKLRILESMMDIKRKAKMIGDFNNNGTKLYTQKLAGGVHGCMGFIKKENSDFNVPNTLLQTDIRDNVSQPFKVYAIFSKSISDEKYNTIEIIDKEISLNEQYFPENICMLLDNKIF